MNRVAITGIGVVSPVGSDLESYWDALVEGRSGIGPLTSIPTERLNIRIAAEVKNHVPEKNFDVRAVPRIDRFAQFAVIAARHAVAVSGLVFGEELAQATASGNGDWALDEIGLLFSASFVRSVSTRTACRRPLPLALVQLRIARAYLAKMMERGAAVRKVTLETSA